MTRRFGTGVKSVFCPALGASSESTRPGLFGGTTCLERHRLAKTGTAAVLRTGSTWDREFLVSVQSPPFSIFCKVTVMDILTD